MTEKKLSNRIPEADVDAYRRWKLPLIDDRGQVLPSAEREAAARRAAERKKRGERVEDVDFKGPVGAGMSAGELEKIVQAAEREGFEQGRQAGFEKGQAEGYEAGQEQGLIDKRQELTAEQQRFQHLVQSLLEPLSEQDEQIEAMLLDIVCTLTRSLVERELLTDSSHILSLVKAAVAALPTGTKHLHLYLNPDDLALVEAYAEEHQFDWQFHGDESLLPGGCRVEASESRVDYSVENRLKQQLDAFVNRQLGEGEDPGIDAQDQVQTLSAAAESDAGLDGSESDDRGPES